MNYYVLFALPLSLFLMYAGWFVGNAIANWFRAWRNRVNNNLKPCPFCGSNNVSKLEGICNYYYVKCLACSCIGPKHDSRRQSVKAWNKREQINNALYNIFNHWRSHSQ